MSLKELQSKFKLGLSQLYPQEEIASFFQLLTNHQLSMSKIDLVLKPDFTINKTDLDFFLYAFAELKQEKPIQYILKKTDFYGLPFKVTKDVLIPRPETEELVDWIIYEIKEKRKKKKENTTLKILDIGTGSGCIAIALAKHLPTIEVYALDVSKKALEIAKQNASMNDVSINFIQQNILDTTVISTLSSSNEEALFFDIIVSNPPYIRELEKQEIKKNVLENEPHLALFVKDDNPLLFYNKIAAIAKKQLNKNGLLFFEINQYLGKKTVKLLAQKEFKNIVLKKDLFGNDRMIRTTY